VRDGERNCRGHQVRGKVAIEQMACARIGVGGREGVVRNRDRCAFARRDLPDEGRWRRAPADDRIACGPIIGDAPVDPCAGVAAARDPGPTGLFGGAADIGPAAVVENKL
jgi:hypothetical protein